MKAAVLLEKQRIEVQDLPLPKKIGSNSVLVRLAFVGVCGSDVLRFGIGKGYGFPLVLGHEMSGVVEETSPSGAFVAGEKVAIFPCLPDPSDPMAKVGEWALSKGYDYFGSRRNGGMQEFLEVPEENLVRIPSDVSLLQAAMVEPSAVALHAIRKLDIPANSTALVIGAGPIGNFASQWLRFRGVSKVYVADIDAKKRKVMDRLGFETLDASWKPTPEQIADVTGGRGVDITVEASGSPFTLVQAIESAAAQGQVVLLGDLSADLSLTKEQVSSVLRRELKLYGTWNSKIQPSHSSEWDMVVNAIGSGLQLSDLVSHVFSIDEAQARFEELFERKIWFNKVMFAVSEQAKQESATEIQTSLSATLARES